MLVHHCQKCGKISLNRIAADDDNEAILDLYNSSIEQNISIPNIAILSKKDEKELRKQLFGEIKSPNK